METLWHPGYGIRIFFFINRLTELVPPPLVASIMAKLEQIVRERFGNFVF